LIACGTASDQKLEVRRPGNKVRIEVDYHHVMLRDHITQHLVDILSVHCTSLW